MQKKIEKLRELKLLFVEDEEDLLSIISDALLKLGANFSTATNGLEALEIVEKESNFDAIITDINMPYMNGLDLIKTLKEREINIPVIVMSAHTEMEYISKAKEFGVFDYLLKPFDFVKFIELITDMDIDKK